MKKTLVSILFLALGMQAFAQREMTMYHFDGLYQATYVNPVARPVYKASIGLPFFPSFQFGVAHGRYGMSDVFRKQEGSTVPDYHKLPSLVGNRNPILSNFSYDLLSVQANRLNHSITFHVRTKYDGIFTYPGDLVKIAVEGNAQFENEEADLSGLSVNQSVYQEIALGYARGINEKWRVGGRVKVLFGLANVSTDIDELAYSVDENYGWNGRVDGRVNVGGVPGYLIQNEDADESDIDAMVKNALSNWGLGLDLGVGYQFNDRLDLSASLVDLGFIRWRGAPQNYSLKGEAIVEGVDMLGTFLRDEEVDTEEMADSLLGLFDTASSQNAYTTALHYNLYIGGKYKITPRSSVTGLLNVTGYKGLRSAFSLGFHHELGRVFQFTITNTSQYGQLINPGFGFTFKPGPFQIFMMADNLKGLTQLPLDPTTFSTNNVNFRFGINLVFGKLYSEDMLVCPDMTKQFQGH